MRRAFNWKSLLLLAPPTAVILLLWAQDSISRQALVGETIDKLVPGYFGLISNVTIAFWLIGGACACFSALVLWPRTGAGREQALFFGAFGLWTLWLGFDDAFVMHEQEIPNRLGVGQHIVTASYVVITLALLWRFRRSLVNAQLPMIVTSFVFMTASEAIDQFTAVGSNNYMEESFKFLGVTAWAVYWVLHGVAVLRAMPPADDERNTLGSE